MVDVRIAVRKIRLAGYPVRGQGGRQGKKGRVRRLNGWGRGILLSVIALSVTALLGGCALQASAQRLQYTKRPDVENGAKVYKGGCIACHGSEGKGAPMASTVFLRPDTFPDFTDCAGTTPEPDGNWKAVIVHGGPSRGLSQIMPAFGDLLTDDQINDVVAYMRGFCRNVHHDPLGELNR